MGGGTTLAVGPPKYIGANEADVKKFGLRSRRRKLASRETEALLYTGSSAMLHFTSSRCRDFSDRTDRNRDPLVLKLNRLHVV